LEHLRGNKHNDVHLEALINKKRSLISLGIKRWWQSAPIL